jgi:ssDNA thymidine ADP-ribosyltransferase DarT-like protein
VQEHTVATATPKSLSKAKRTSQSWSTSSVAFSFEPELNMLNADPLQRIPVLYHFTDRRNIPLIRQVGGLCPLAELAEKNVQIPAPGGNEWSHDADKMKGLDKYVHLCFRPKHPMEYVARAEGRVGETIFLRIDREVLHWEGVRFTQDVSNKSGVESHSIEEAKNMIDFDVLYTRMEWRDKNIWQRLSQAEKCEILVPKCIPLKLIQNFPNG